MVAHKLVSIRFPRMEFSQIFQLKPNKELSQTLSFQLLLETAQHNNLVASWKGWLVFVSRLAEIII